MPVGDGGLVLKTAMKAFLILTLGFCMAFSGCVPPIQHSPTCQSYVQLVKESWSYDKGKERYSVGGPSPMESFKRLFNEKECMYTEPCGSDGQRLGA